MPTISAIKVLRLKGHKFKACLHEVVRPCLKNPESRVDSLGDTTHVVKYLASMN